MPAQSQQQQKLFGLALAVKRGEAPRSEASADVLNIVDTMSEKQIEDFASTPHSGLPKKVESFLREFIRNTMREEVIDEAELPNAVIPSNVKVKLNQAIDKIKDSNLTYNQKLQVIGKIIDSLGVDKKELTKMSTRIKSTLESIEEAISSKDLEKIKGAVESASSFMSVGSELKKLGMRYIFATSPMPVYIVQDKSGNRVGIVNKKYATKPDFVVGDIAVGVMENTLKEGLFQDIMKGVKKGDGPFTLVVIKNNKVVKQVDAKTPQVIPAHYTSLEKEFPNSRIRVEDSTGKIVFGESINEADVVGKTVFSDGKGKLFFGYYKTDDAVEFVDYKTWKKLNFKDVSKGDTNKERVIKAILKNQKQFNKKVDFNMWAKKQKRSFEDTMDWFIQNGWINNINKGGIKESVDVLSVNEDRNSNMFYVLYQKKGVFGKPAAAGYKDRKDAEKFAKSLGNNHNTMILDKQSMKNVKGVDVKEGKKRFKRQDGIGKAKYTISYHDGKKKHKDGSDFFDIKIFKNKKDLSDFVGTLVKQGYKLTNESVNEDKEQIAQIKKSVNKNEIKFYDALSKVEKKLGSKYKAFLDKALKDFKQNPNSFKTIADKEEKLFQLAK